MARTTNLAAAENRARKYAKETAWMRYERMNDFTAHRRRIDLMKHSVDCASPHRSRHLLLRQKRAEMEGDLGGASNWIGVYAKNPKDLSDIRPWRTSICSSKGKGDPAPFSTLKLTPRGDDSDKMKSEIEVDETVSIGNVMEVKGIVIRKRSEGSDKLRVIERNVMEMKGRIRWIHNHYTLYSPKKKLYLARGEAQWTKPPVMPSTVDEKLEQTSRKWRMQTRSKPNSPNSPPQKSGLLLELLFPACKSPETDVDSGVAQLHISPVTEEEAGKDPQLAQLKVVQEAGDPNF